MPCPFLEPETFCHIPSKSLLSSNTTQRLRDRSQQRGGHQGTMGNDMGRTANRMAIGAMANATHFEKKELLRLQASRGFNVCPSAVCASVCSCSPAASPPKLSVRKTTRSLPHLCGSRLRGLHARSMVESVTTTVRVVVEVLIFSLRQYLPSSPRPGPDVDYFLQGRRG